ncbi:gephyrin-like molybdotransferase Glp [Sphingorhabdus sp. Alg239-R122]|uniref:molybdopterin molybdotransferase MoeA n=1 Tax=Sphingorhabdus sp. Alg239-R122 TaxID=2305989 RepID=UPI0013DC94D4|nr:gephyrin-like molybdotransferase Glp [Sphingorhabdus sp. Alg239-R122]
MISADEARHIIDAISALGQVETVTVDQALDRICAADIPARITHPPFRASAMDGYAVRLEDVRHAGAKLKVIGESRAGEAAGQLLDPEAAIRIFTGGVVPEGADHVIIQENVERKGGTITTCADQAVSANIRRAGIDFCEGDILKRGGARLNAIDVGLLAAANIADVRVFRRPVIAYFDNGDELVELGSKLQHGQIIGSNRFALDGMIREWGGEPVYLGKAGDTLEKVVAKFEAGLDADIVMSVGGASVGDHDHVRTAFERMNGQFLFQKIAMKPGKPTWFGALGETHVLGLPGNPASALVCATLFLQPLINRLGGSSDDRPASLQARLASPLKANGQRENYMRGTYEVSDSGIVTVSPADNQDSSLLSRLSTANCLIRCPPDMAAQDEGAIVDCIRLT